VTEQQWTSEVQDAVYAALSDYLPHAQVRVAAVNAVLAALDATTPREWGITHSLGLRPESSVETARASLPGMIASHERSSRNRVRPRIVSRPVGPWREEPDTAEETRP
jgi:hypothetical protein